MGEYNHLHTHNQAHGHGHDDHWDGEAYLVHPGLKETAAISAETLVHALKTASFTEDQIKNLHVLEVGCGAGAVTPILARSFASVHAIDTSRSMLAAFSSQPAASLSNVTYSLHVLGPTSGASFTALSSQPSPTKEDVHRSLPPPRSQYDVAVANLVVHHVDDLAAFFAGVWSVLKPGGWLVVTEFGKAADGTDVVAKIRAKRHEEEERKTLPDGSVNAPHHHHEAYTVYTLGELFRSNGFVNVGGELRGTLPVFGIDSEPVPCVYVAGQKPT